MPSPATSVTDYLAALPADRQAAVKAVRAVIPQESAQGLRRANAGRHDRLRRAPQALSRRLPLQTGRAPALRRFGLAKELHVALPDDCLFLTHSARLAQRAVRLERQKLDMGKCCLRFKKLEDLPLDVIGETIARVPVAEYIRHYEAGLTSRQPKK